jgi:protein TonB
MPRDLFGDVTAPSISIGNRKWYTVPVSLFSHAIVVAMIVIVPILAAPLLPGVLNTDDITYIKTILPPPPPPPARRDPAEIKPVANPDAAPTVAPDGLTKEPETIPDTPVDVLGRIDGGSTAADLVPPPVVVAAAPQQGPVRVGTHSIRTPVKTRDVRPVYPRMAQEARIEGVVIIEATISETGQVINAKTLRSVPLLEQAAIDAVRQWEFTPSMLNGVPVPVIMTVTVTFTLSR